MTWFIKVAERKKQSKRGRASGGYMIGIKKDLSEDWEVKEWDYGFKLINKKESEMLITVYNNVGIDALEKKIKKEVREMENIIEKKIVLGDMNARIGESDVTKINMISEKKRKSKEKKLNAEGNKLLSLCDELGLKILNGVKEGDEEGEITFIGGKSENCCSVLDLVLLLDRGEDDGVKNLKIIKRIESDHLPIVVELERKNADKKKEEENSDVCKGMKKLEQERLVWKKDNIMDYRNAAYDDWQERREISDELQWSDIKEIIHNAAKAAGMSKKANSGKKEVIIEKNDSIMNKGHDEINKKEFIKAKKNFKSAVKKAKEEWWGEKKNEIAKAKDMSKWWEVINKFRRKRKKNKSAKIDMRTNGRLDEPFGRLEFIKAVKRLGNRKASGEDGIAAEFMKNLPRDVLEEIREIINKMWEESKFQEGWEKARIIPIYKTGDVNKAENYRGISLLDIGYKILTAMMAERIVQWTDREEKIKESQAGFRKGRGTRDHVFMLNMLINNQLKRKEKLFMCFIDLRQAFDTVDRRMLLEKLWKLGIRGKMHKMIKVIYGNTTSEIIIEGTKTREFGINQGVRQGCALSAVLFNIFIDDMEDEIVRKNIGGTVIGKEKLFMAKYADDGAALTSVSGGWHLVTLAYLRLDRLIGGKLYNH
ncbi:Similar to LINE-1 reverse transcriptase homolog (Nycticebus coucang) [Cotesia congregata]|uniref:Similar to LINE-1 reverse transcriptase homolog (Nycticebus coucang) n=1 Tax=Cotesia congregata TaxID=51543 RepID=A0A8J2HUH9_COTCN|nr:Similar to LINE-1 reverse transcriptase homolog (Nycticebus coucang) [Cotesia congregata]